MEATHWSQQTALVKTMTDMVSSSYPKPLLDRKARPQKEQALNCPRCHSTNTKFCYYNNYSLTQPRYFCKSCRRYWTEGGSLRNVPVGGGSRKNKRSSSSSTSTSKKIHEVALSGSSQIPSQNTRILEGQDLNLTIQSTPDFHHTMNEFGVLANNGSANNNYNPSALELLNGISSRGLNHFNPIMPLQTPEPNVLYTNVFGVPYLRPTLTFPLDDNNLQEIPDSSGRLMYQPEDLKPNFHQNRNQGETTGYWNGVLGNCSW